MAGEPHVLIVDDERDILDPLASYVAKNGFRVSKAQNAAAAREILAAHAIDIALIDIMMPGEDGLSLAGFIRATSKVPVILVTAKAEETDRIVGHVRPFTDPVGATWQALLRAWPGATTPTSAVSDGPATDTSLIQWHAARYA